MIGYQLKYSKSKQQIYNFQILINYQFKIYNNLLIQSFTLFFDRFVIQCIFQFKQRAIYLYIILFIFYHIISFQYSFSKIIITIDQYSILNILLIILNFKLFFANYILKYIQLFEQKKDFTPYFYFFITSLILLFEINIQTACRIRPFTSKEFYENNDNVANQLNNNTIQISEDKLSLNEYKSNKQFSFDQVFGENDNNIKIFNDSVVQLVDKSLLEGFNSTILVYGQTASGKTYTISSQDDSVIWQIGKRLFQNIQDNPDDNISISLQMLEIYNEQIRDLLSIEEKKITLRENNQGKTIIVNCSQKQLKNYLDFQKQINIGLQQSSYASTEMNDRSSRSHVVYKIYLESYSYQSVLVVVDLAGSERLAKTNLVVKQRLREANNINLSLQVLNLCINKLSQGQTQHIPYRSSTLTRILQESLGGNSMTLIIGCVSPASSNASESISTCQFLQMAKKVVNAPTISKQFDGKNAEELRKRLVELEKQIKDYKEQNDNKIPEINWNDSIFQEYMDIEDIEKIRQLKQNYNKDYSDSESIFQGIIRLRQLNNVVQEIKQLAEQQLQEQNLIEETKQQLIEQQQKYTLQNKKNQELNFELQQLQQEDNIITITNQQIEQEVQNYNNQISSLNEQLAQLQKLYSVQQKIMDNFIPQSEIIFYKRQQQYEDTVDYCKNLMKQVRKAPTQYPENNQIPLLNCQKVQKNQTQIKQKRQTVAKMGDDEPSIDICNIE